MWQALLDNKADILGGLGIFGDLMGTESAIESNIDITRQNVEARLLDAKQIRVSMGDQAKQLARGTRKAAGRMKSMIASSNLVLQGSPLMALEETYQRGEEDLKALHEDAEFKMAGVQKKISMDYLKSASDVRGMQYATAGRTFEAAEELWG